MSQTLAGSLFGLKDFGELTLPELMAIHTRIYGSAGVYPPERLQSWFQCEAFRWAARDIGPNHTSPRYIPDTPPRVKYQEIYNQLFDPDHKYRVKFEVLRKTYSDLDQPSAICLYAIDIWIDDVLLNDSSKSPYPWFNLYSDTDPCKHTAIYKINDAHQKYIHALHYATFKANMARITEELVADSMHPRRLMRHLELGGDPDDF